LTRKIGVLGELFESIPMPTSRHRVSASPGTVSKVRDGMGMAIEGAGRVHDGGALQSSGTLAESAFGRDLLPTAHLHCGPLPMLTRLETPPPEAFSSSRVLDGWLSQTVAGGPFIPDGWAMETIRSVRLGPSRLRLVWERMGCLASGIPHQRVSGCTIW
jgi:hypothetical protein